MPLVQPLGRSELMVPRLGVGAMTWGDAYGLARLHPAKIAYGGAEGREEERGAWEASLAAGVTLFDTAAMYAGGASERRLGELSCDAALIATKFPATMWATADDLPRQLADSLARLRRESVDVYQHHFPSRRVDIPRLMNVMADAVTAGQVRAVGVSNYSAGQMRQAHAALARRHPPRVQSGGVLAAAPPPRDERGVGRLPGARRHPHRLSAAGQRRAHGQVLPDQPASEACGASSSPSAAGIWQLSSRSPPCFSRSASATAKPLGRWPCAG